MRGVGIGKIKVGMPRAQVERVFGKDSIVNARAKIGSWKYVQLGWNFGTSSVGFLKHGSTYRVTEAATSLRGQRTTAGIGVGSSFKAAARAYPQAICTGYFPTMGTTTQVTIGPGMRANGVALVVAQDRKQLAFMLKPRRTGSATAPWFVYEVVVRDSVPGAVDFVPNSRCYPDWRLAGKPYP